MITAVVREITNAVKNRMITVIDAAIYRNIPVHTSDREGIFPEIFLVLMAEKKKGRKKTRYIRIIDVQKNPSVWVSSRFPVDKKKARTIMPAPARKSRTLKNND
jgi:hypothetical protein